MPAQRSRAADVQRWQALPGRTRAAPLPATSCSTQRDWQRSVASIGLASRPAGPIWCQPDRLDLAAISIHSTVVSQPAQSEIAARSTARYSFRLWTDGPASPPDHATDASPAPSGHWICSGARAESNVARRDFGCFSCESGVRAGSCRARVSRTCAASKHWELLPGSGNADMCRRGRGGGLYADAG